ncbi:Alanine--tRNA ligase [Buchnera aphidicola (Cinara pseudotaxifoliae)]|uniref:Alanine--tRNA ligase n=1 Tax=Buchnera aphidicola (Cinara pseudotaxifoliae) TaxID=655384 RepID=A0A451DHE6_9GAMM|nr:alanine--tRNA ligase [Buchnera aphidicola]VFP86032.1 Alanine--tRNA ligase [Buchnera aphidicola (Cinara pseudotaxifoliae)]
MKTDKIRSLFLQFFKEKNHIIVKSGSLIPKNDNTLLFTNAGMNQFKEIYLGYKKNHTSSYTSSQYCIRTGGKHNDFNKVGYEPYHHTLFEMLGNFSFGEYFKETSIVYAWEFLTHKNWLNMSKKKIWITYYYNDIETKNIWLNKIKIKPNHLITIYDKNNIEYHSNNFWKMGNSGPCGPCTEIFYDTRKKNNTIKNHDELKKYCVEIWNLVFMQFNQTKSNKLIELPIPSVDTGMGLERISAVLQNVSSSYETDNFIKLIQFIKKNIKIKSYNYISLRIIADHIRTATCLISEKVIPGNEGRSYVLRRIIRRVLSHGYFIGLHKPFFYKLSEFIINSMKQMDLDFNISSNINFIKKTLLSEEQQFYRILKIGMHKLKKEIIVNQNKKLCEKKIFHLYETFGLPIEITQDICKEKKISINFQKLNQIIESNKKKQKKKNIKKIQNNSCLIYVTKKSIFDGYYEYVKKSKITQIIYKNQSVLCLSEKCIGTLVLDITPFYGESSGQIGDSGTITNEKGKFIVHDTQKNGNFIAHQGYLEKGILHVGKNVVAKIDVNKRKKIQSNHTALHLLHAALIKKFGLNVIQKGSYINNEYFRFDFICNNNITEKDIQKLEIIINKKIQKNIKINAIITSFSRAKKYKAVYLSSKKYKNTVRMICINNFSIELCSGTHHKSTGKIGCFKIIKNKNIGNSIKRITAITGINVILYIQKKTQKEKKIKKLLNNNSNDTYKSIKNLVKKIHCIEKEKKDLTNQNILQISKNLMSKAYIINNISIIVSYISHLKYTMLTNISDIIKQKKESVIMILINKNTSITRFLISVTNNIIQYINAVDIMNIMLSLLSGTGGGNKNIVKGKLNNKNITPTEIKKIKKKIIKHVYKNNVYK